MDASKNYTPADWGQVDDTWLNCAKSAETALGDKITAMFWSNHYINKKNHELNNFQENEEVIADYDNDGDNDDDDKYNSDLTEYKSI